MKITLSFNEEEVRNEEHKPYLNALNLAMAIDEFKNYLRYQRKHADKEPTFDEIHDKFYEILKDNDILDLL